MHSKGTREHRRGDEVPVRPCASLRVPVLICGRGDPRQTETQIDLWSCCWRPPRTASGASPVFDVATLCASRRGISGRRPSGRAHSPFPSPASRSPPDPPELSTAGVAFLIWSVVGGRRSAVGGRRSASRRRGKLQLMRSAHEGRRLFSNPSGNRGRIEPPGGRGFRCSSPSSALRSSPPSRGR